jgi:hypothetical protein
MPGGTVPEWHMKKAGEVIRQPGFLRLNIT